MLILQFLDKLYVLLFAHFPIELCAQSKAVMKVFLQLGALAVNKVEEIFRITRLCIARPKIKTEF